MRPAPRLNIEEFSIGENVRFYGYGLEIDQKGNARQIIEGKDSMGYFNGSVMRIVAISESLGSSSVELKDEYSARMEEEPVRYWTGHFGQIKKLETL